MLRQHIRPFALRNLMPSLQRYMHCATSCMYCCNDALSQIAIVELVRVDGCLTGPFQHAGLLSSLHIRLHGQVREDGDE